MKKIICILLLLATSFSANADFLQGQVLKAAGLNSTIAKPTILGGTLTRLSSPVLIGSGGKGSATATGATSQLQYIQGKAGSVARSITNKLQDVVNAKDFGMVGDGVTLNDTQFANFFAAVVASGSKGYIASGNYKFASPVVMDYASKATTGFVLEGEGVQRTVFTSAVAFGNAFSLICSGGTVPSPVIGVYPKITQIGFKSAHNGVTFAVGKSDLSDQQNLVRLEIWLGNSHDGSSAVVFESNNVYGSSFEFNAGLGVSAATGVVVKMRQTEFTKFFISASSTAVASLLTGTAKGVYITQGFSYGNTFISPDLEVLYNAVYIDSPNASNNTFIGGTYSLLGNAAVIGTAGNNNLFIQPNLNSPGVPFFIGGTNGIGVSKLSSDILQTASPSKGQTVQINTDTKFLKLTSSNLDSLSVALPLNPFDGMTVQISSYGSIAQLTVTSTLGVFDGGVIAVPIGGSVSYKYAAANNTWFSLSNSNIAQINKIDIQSPATGATISMLDGQCALKLNHGATIAALTIKLPPNPYDGQSVSIFSKSTVTALTLSSSKTISDIITTLAADTGVRYTYSYGTLSWFRMN